MINIKKSFLNYITFDTKSRSELNIFVSLEVPEWPLSPNRTVHVRGSISESSGFFFFWSAVGMRVCIAWAKSWMHIRILFSLQVDWIFIVTTSIKPMYFFGFFFLQLLWLLFYELFNAEIRFLGKIWSIRIIIYIFNASMLLC